MVLGARRRFPASLLPPHLSRSWTLRLRRLGEDEEAVLEVMRS